MSKQSNNMALIQEMVQRIVQVCDPEQIILFGSYARGDAGRDSDVDFLVVTQLDGLNDKKRSIRLGIRRALSGIGLSKDIIVVTPKEVERYQKCAGTIIRMALRDGKVLYERA
jgi:predicted nucleotidyltransferase